MSRLWSAPGMSAKGFPRVSGDEPVLICGVGIEEQFSPRERG